MALLCPERGSNRSRVSHMRVQDQLDTQQRNHAGTGDLRSDFRAVECTRDMRLTVING